MVDKRPRGARRVLALAGALLLPACGDGEPITGTTRAELADEVRRLAAEHGIDPLDAPPVRAELVALGRALAFDPILSGNHDISCMTCHHPSLATGDGRHLSIGQGATGLGPDRVHPDGAFIPRHAPALFDLHAHDAAFWDGRVEVDGNGTVHTPAGAQLTPEMAAVFEFGAVSAQPMFPVLSREEMRGTEGNELAAIPDDSIAAIWRALMARLGGIDEYRQLFEAAYPGTDFEAMTFAHASNAIVGFLIARLSFDDAPWDRFLAGDDEALTETELQGAKLFMQPSTQCAECHSGPTFTDGDFHNVAMPQLGPGVGDGPSGRDDYGRFRVTGNEAHRYAFRTPPLRNVELTAPYGHAGQIVFLSDFVDHYGDAATKLRGYEAAQLEPALQGTVLDNEDAILATMDTLLDGLVLEDSVVGRLTLFLRTLTDPAARDLTHLVPERVPSGLPVQ